MLLMNRDKHLIIRRITCSAAHKDFAGVKTVSPRNKRYIYLQLQKRLKIRLEPICAMQYYISTLNKPPVSFREFPCWSAVDLAMWIRDLQTGDSNRFDPDRLPPTARIEST
ncbi:MAG: hypothetical protein WAK66_07155 [Methylocystis sp.]